MEAMVVDEMKTSPEDRPDEPEEDNKLVLGVNRDD